MMEILGFFAGLLLFFTQSIHALLLIVGALFIKPQWSTLIWFVIALFWGIVHQCLVSDYDMPTASILPTVALQGEVVSIPKNTLTKLQFEFDITSLNNKPVRARVLLSCYQHCPLFQVGERWSMLAKLKKPNNLGNPGRFDLVKHLNARHIHWTGYLKGRAIRLKEQSNKLNLLLIRERLAKQLGKTTSEKAILGVLQALTVGLTTNLEQAQWDLFRRTGTTHLMVISGSHIGLVAGFCYWLMKWLWSRSYRLCLYFPSLKSASIFGFLCAGLYTLLAGFAPPAQRALIACFFLFLRYFIPRRFSAWQAWRYGLFAVLVYEPHALLFPGFYLSFVAVAILFLINQRFSAHGLRKLFYLQAACLGGLIPLTLYWFSYGSLIGFFANILAIPLVSFLIVPLALIHLIILQYIDDYYLAKFIYYLIYYLYKYLYFIDSFSWVNLSYELSGFLAPMSFMFCMFFLLLFPIKPMLPMVLVLGICSFFPSYPRVKEGDLIVDVLDVGQGLSVLIRTTRHNLVYDTGAKFYQGKDMGELALIPYFKTLGITKLDKVIVSHSDLDHRGGLPTLQKKYPIDELIVDQVSFYQQASSCHEHLSWTWEGVSFRFLAIEGIFRDKNNHSCVLQIEHAAGKMLLPGDIEREAEYYLMNRYQSLLHSTVLLIPHHGSKTSSSPYFIQGVNPQYAVISYGLDNRYHFPHPQTIRTLEQLKIPAFNTSDCGMISFHFKKKNKKIEINCFSKKNN